MKIDKFYLKLKFIFFLHYINRVILSRIGLVTVQLILTISSPAQCIENSTHFYACIII